MNESAFFIESSTKVNFPTPEICESCYKSFLPEMEEFQTSRSILSMEKAEKHLIFGIKSKDMTAYRATISSIVGFGKIYEKVLSLCGK